MSEGSGTLGTLGRYELIEELGRGGMGVVYVAYDPQVERRVALKVISQQLASDPDFRARFQREMRIAAQLEHPHIVPVYETGSADGSLYMAMRLIPGADLGRVLQTDAPLDPDRATRIARQIGSALDAAHARGLVHRDVKPNNVLVTGSGDEEHAYLTDFGLTRDASSTSGLTNTGQWVGTADFVAPEQLEGRPVTARSDVYSLSCLLYMCVTGRLPYEGTVARKLFAHLNSELPSVGPEVVNHEAVDEVLRRGAAKDSDLRYPSAGDLSRAFSAALAGRGIELNERTVAIGAALSGVSESETRQSPVEPLPPPPADATILDQPTLAPTGPPPFAPAPTPTTRVQPPGPPPLPPPPPGGGDRRSATPWIVAAAIVVLAAGGGAAVLLAGGKKDKTNTQVNVQTLTDTDTSSTPVLAATTPSTTTTPATETSTDAQTATTPVQTAPVQTQGSGAITFAPYSPPSGTYDAQIPIDHGWRNLGERAINPRLFETKLHGPGHQVILIDATPEDAPQFGHTGRSVLSHQTFTSRYGDVDEWKFVGSPPTFCESGPCTDYQLTVNSHAGVAVLGGPVAAARTIAARVMTSVVPHV